MSTKTLSLVEGRALALSVLAASNVSEVNAAAVADALIAAEADGLASHGLSRLPAYADQARSGKVDGQADPVITRPRTGIVAVDARSGYAYRPIREGLDQAADAVGETGVAAVAIANSHHFGVAGYHVESLARKGLVGLAFGNSPAAIAPWGGNKALFGTNPIAFACPTGSDEPVVVDLSLSKVARGKIMVAAQRGEPIPEGWALDPDGNETTDAKAALEGTMIPMGDAKGAALVMVVEILATCFTGANFGYQASSFFDAEGAPPHVGQFFLVIDPDAFSGAPFKDRVAMLLGAMTEQDGVRIPGRRRFDNRAAAEANGITITDQLHEALQSRAG